VTERQQTVAHRARKAPAKSSRPAQPKRRGGGGGGGGDATRWVRYVAAAALAAVPVMLAYFLIVDSKAFGLKRVEVSGTHRAAADKIEEAVREAAGGRFLGADLETIRKAVEDERYVQAASVVRVLPDTIRVEIREREPAIVARVGNKLTWVDEGGRLLDEFKSENGEIPPPLSGFEAGDQSERAAADNRDRIATYMNVKDALQKDNLWDRVDEVEIRLLGDVRVRLADTGIQVRLGDREYRERLVRALNRIEEIRRAEEARLNSPEAAAGEQGPAGGAHDALSLKDISLIDAASSTGRVTAVKGPSAQGSRRN
jgi:cell division septal protein FtsQ